MTTGDMKTFPTIDLSASGWVARHQRALVFVDGGRTWPRVDCFGWLLHAYDEQLGLQLPDWHDLTLDSLALARRSLLEPRFTAGFTAVEQGFEQAFDGALIRQPAEVNGHWVKDWLHCGIVSRPGFILHCAAGQGLVETPFRDTGVARRTGQLRPKDVLLFRPPQEQCLKLALPHPAQMTAQVAA